MASPFQFPASAFAVFYDTPVAFRGIRPGDRPVAFVANCCVIEDSPDIQADGAALDEDVDTAVNQHTVLIPKSDWPDETPPQRGDVLTFYSADHYVYKADEENGDWKLTVREGK